MADPLPYPGAPTWVKVSGIIAVGVVLLIVILFFTGIGGPHGPDRHMPAGDALGSTPPSSAQRP